MGVDIHKLIAAISPDVYCDSGVRKEVKKIVKSELAKGNKEAYLVAAKTAKVYKSPTPFKWDDAKKDPLSNWGLKSPTEQHEILYDSAGESLEPLYFWILNFMEARGGDLYKLVDNFSSSPGSGHFSELGQKATRMQEEAMKMLGAVNQVIKSILNLIYDLKEFKILLSTYKELRSENEAVRGGALLSLKQRWMDLVDMAKRGTTSIKQLAAQFDYVTLIDAFMAAPSLKSIDEMDLNDRVKRLLKQRLSDFFKWVEESEKELNKRYDIEKRYLLSQVNTVKLYARWIKPYLKAARKLEQPDQIGKNPASLVTAFNTIMLELKIMASKEYDPKDDVIPGILPKVFEKVKARKYHAINIVEFEFRGIPNRVSQRGDWSFGGRTGIKFFSYALNEQELAVLKDQVEKDDFGDVMKLIDGATTETLGELQKDIDEFLSEDKLKEEKENVEEDINPFTSLFSFFSFNSKAKEKEDYSKGIRPDNEYEKVIRSQAIIEARDSCFTLFDIYKRAHGMPAHESPFDIVD